MAFPVRMISSKADCLEAEIDVVPITLEFEDWMDLVAIVSKVDALVKFNEPTSKPFIHLANMAYNWFFPIKRIIVQAKEEKGKFYAWGEKI
jgi:hypothetical protein